MSQVPGCILAESFVLESSKGGLGVTGQASSKVAAAGSRDSGNFPFLLPFDKCLS